MNQIFHKEIIENVQEGAFFVDLDRIVTYWNEGAEQITGYDSQQAVGCACHENLLNHVTVDGVQLCEKNCPLAEVMEDGIPREAEVFLHRADGHRLPVVVRATALRNRMGKIVGAIESFSNQQPTVKTHSRPDDMQQINRTDPLTKLGNRMHLQERLHEAIEELKHTQSTAGLLFMDIDHFKHVNNTHGQNVGDKVLCMLTNTFGQAIRSTDTIGRWGGEEFVAIVHDILNEKILSGIAEKVRKLIEAACLQEGGQSLRVTISIGATCLSSSDTPESAIRRADELMYRSKLAGRNRVTME